MIFKSLEEKCRYYQSLADYKLMPNSYVLCHLDGRSFSRDIKTKFELPFSSEFMDIMNQVAQYLCHEVQGCVLAYIQSDEITLVLTDFGEDGPGDGFFGYRMCKIQSICASMASGKFNQLMIVRTITKPGWNNAADITCGPIYQFDCKCWSVPSYNDAFSWILYRQIDCIRNSKQQTAQTWCSYEELLGKTSDEQIQYLKEKVGVDWNGYTADRKYGRFIKKNVTAYMLSSGGEYTRNSWDVIPGEPLTDEECRERFKNEIFIKKN